MELNQQKLNEFLGRAVVDIGATLHAGLVVLGEKLGLYKALAAAPMTPAELAEKTDTTERYVREWLNAQAAGGYVMYDAASGRYSLSAEQAFALADEWSRSVDDPHGEGVSPVALHGLRLSRSVDRSRA